MSLTLLVLHFTHAFTILPMHSEIYILFTTHAMRSPVTGNSPTHTYHTLPTHKHKFHILLYALTYKPHVHTSNTPFTHTPLTHHRSVHCLHQILSLYSHTPTNTVTIDISRDIAMVVSSYCKNYIYIGINKYYYDKSIFTLMVLFCTIYTGHTFGYSGE